MLRPAAYAAAPRRTAHCPCGGRAAQPNHPHHCPLTGSARQTGALQCFPASPDPPLTVAGVEVLRPPAFRTGAAPAYRQRCIFPPLQLLFAYDLRGLGHLPDSERSTPINKQTYALQHAGWLAPLRTGAGTAYRQRCIFPPLQLLSAQPRASAYSGWTGSARQTGALQCFPASPN